MFPLHKKTSLTEIYSLSRTNRNPYPRCHLDSQHHRISVKALLPLSPLQRFSVLTLFPNVSHLHCAVNRANLIFPIHDLVVFSRSDLVYNRIDHKEDHAHDCDRHVKGKGIHDQYHP